MCYDISFDSSVDIITSYFPHMKIESQVDMNFDAVHLVAHAYPKYPIVIYEDGKYDLRPMEWGLIASYMNTPDKIKEGRRFMLNARSEKILDKKAYWNKIRNNRCLIPVSGIYEHREISGWKNKVPYYVKIHGRQVFYLPGLYNNSPIPDPETAEVIQTFTLITREANELMSQIHNGGDNKFRMPLFLSPELELKWLKPDLTDSEIEEILNYCIDSDELEYWTVYSVRGRKERPDGEPKNAPYDYEGLPQLEYELP